MQNSDGRFELIAAGSDGKIYKLAEEATGRWGNNWVAIGEQNSVSLTRPVFVGSNINDGRLQVFATDEKGMVYSNWQQTPGADGRAAGVQWKTETGWHSVDKQVRPSCRS